MYAQMVETGVKKVKDAAEMTSEERAFQARIDADVKIEPRDPMPDAYRSTPTRRSSACFPRATGSGGRRR